MFKSGNKAGTINKTFKTCILCNKVESLRGRARSPNCTECNYKKNKLKFKSYRRGYNLKYLYNITEVDFDILYSKQNGFCAVCNMNVPTTDMVVDHCHTTGKIRGLLCHLCNRGLGQFKDNWNLLIRAADYLKENL